MWNEALKSVAAGLMIGIAGAIYLAIGPPLGAFLFAIGLIVICACGFNLYTGKVGYIQRPKEIVNLGVYISGNAFGTLIMAATQSMSAQNLVSAHQLMEAKLTFPWWLALIKAIGCGFLMYIAVNIYKEKQSYIGIITCIPAFILVGFEHSIADMFYFWLSGLYTWRAAVFLLIVLAGNAIGANLHRLHKIANIEIPFMKNLKQW